MTTLEFEILNQLYFVEPYQTLVSEINVPENILRNELKEMIKKGWVQIMKFDDKIQDYVPTHYLNSDDMYSCFFLATKEGLLKHNGR